MFTISFLKSSSENWNSARLPNIPDLLFEECFQLHPGVGAGEVGLVGVGFDK
jgi:hypothetical protein